MRDPDLPFNMTVMRAAQSYFDSAFAELEAATDTSAEAKAAMYARWLARPGIGS